MVRDEGFEPPIADSESTALPLGESRKKTLSEFFSSLSERNYKWIYAAPCSCKE